MNAPEPPAPEPQVNRVRPYTLTGGRTRASVNLPPEAPVEALQSALSHHWAPNDMRGKIVQLCVKSPSVAEISARLDLPLGVARVLVSDLVTSGYLHIRPTLDDHSSRDERSELIGRTLRGLRALR